MNCENYREMISLYIDNQLDQSGKEKLLEHLEKCDSCRADYETLLEIRGILLDSPMLELPENFEEELHERLLNEKVKSGTVESVKIERRKRRGKINWKFYTSVAALLLLMIVSVGVLQNIDLGTKNNKAEIAQDSSGSTGGVAAPMEAPSIHEKYTMESLENGLEQYSLASGMGEDQTHISSIVADSDRKIIMNGYLSLEVTDFDDTHDKIVEITVSRGGFLQSSSTRLKYYNRRDSEELKEGEITIRVPDDEFYNTYNDIKTLGKVTDSRINTTDITGEYRDTVSEVENLKIQEEALRNVMEKAQNVTEILEVERELTRVRGDINRLTGNIKKWDNLTSLSTIDIYLSEVSKDELEITPIKEGLWDQGKRSFIQTTNNILRFSEKALVTFIGALPVIFIVVALGLIALAIFKKINKK